MTGAPMPAGADAVVMVERTRSVGRRRRDPRSGDARRSRAARGRRPRNRPARVRSRHAAHARAPRRARQPRRGRARVPSRARGWACAPPATSSSASGPLAPGLIRDSNRPMLLAVLEEAGCEPVDYGIARDDEATLTETITRAVDECDALVTSGAVSMGDYDFVKVVLERLAGRAPGQHVRVDADRDQAGQAARVRGDRRRAGVRAAGQPGVVPRELRAARPARAAEARGPSRRAARARARRGRERLPAPARRSAALRPGDRPRTRTAGTCASGPGSRPATCSRAWPRPRAWRSSRTAKE